MVHTNTAMIGHHHVNVQTGEEVRQGNHLYLDKTKELIRETARLRISRPLRAGYPSAQRAEYCIIISVNEIKDTDDKDGQLSQMFHSTSHNSTSYLSYLWTNRLH